MYMCMVLVYFLTLRRSISIFEEKKSWMVISIDVSTKHLVIKAERAQTKSRNCAIGYRRILPQIEIMLLGDTLCFIYRVFILSHCTLPQSKKGSVLKVRIIYFPYLVLQKLTLNDNSSLYVTVLSLNDLQLKLSHHHRTSNIIFLLLLLSKNSVPTYDRRLLQLTRDCYVIMD